VTPRNSVGNAPVGGVAVSGLGGTNRVSGRKARYEQEDPNRGQSSVKHWGVLAGAADGAS
jgi:hypothetical protein